MATGVDPLAVGPPSSINDHNTLTVSKNKQDLTKFDKDNCIVILS